MPINPPLSDDDKPDLAITTVTLWCGHCGLSSINFEKSIVFRNAAPHDLPKEMIRASIDMGWQAEVFQRHQISTCPDCQKYLKKRIDRKYKRHVKFNVLNKCPKCGYRSILKWLMGKLVVSSRYCNGLHMCDEGIKPHMHRECQRCKFSWVESI